MGKKLNKFISAFDYIDKILIVLPAASGGISTIFYTSVTGASVGIASASFSLMFSLTTRIIKKLLKITRNSKKTKEIKKRNIIKLLCQLKENLVLKI